MNLKKIIVLILILTIYQSSTYVFASDPKKPGSQNPPKESESSKSNSDSSHQSDDETINSDDFLEENPDTFKENKYVMMGFINEVPRKVYFNSNSTMFSLAENFLLMCPEFEEEIYKDDEDDYSMSPVFKISYYFNGKSVNDLSLKLCDLGIKAEENILLSPISADPNFDVFMKKITSMNKFCNARYGKISFDKRPKFTFKIKNNDFYAMRRREMQLKDVFNSFKTLEQKFIEDSKISEQLQKSINDMQIGTTNIKDLKNSKLSENSLPTLW